MIRRAPHRRALLAALAMSVVPGVAPAESSSEPAPPPAVAPAAAADAPPPLGLDAKQRLREDDYLRKVEGAYLTGLPLFGYDPSAGFGFGARVYLYENGAKANPLFAYTPYLHRVYAQTFVSTGGVQDHIIDFDAPFFLGTLYRVRATLEYEAANSFPYYGVGSRSLAPLSFPGAPGVSYAKASDYNRATSAVRADGTTYASYNVYDLKHPTLQLGGERLLLGGILRPFIGLGFSYNSVHDSTGQRVAATGANGASAQATEATTLLAADCAAKRVLGCGGGFDNVLRLAISLDTRDLEPDPNRGVYAELSTELSTKVLGSQFSYGRAMLSVRGFYSPIPKIADLVLAARGLYEVQSSGTPFFSQEILPFIDDNHAGLGGGRTLRGFGQNRFVGPVIALTNFEVRWTFAQVKVLKQDLGLMLVPFVDLGRVFDNVSQTTFAGWKRSQGAGFRVSWNEATVMFVDYGFSSEDTGLYINFSHIF